MSTVDKITVSVIQHRLESIVEEMGDSMLRTAYSQILNSSRDFSTAVFDGEGRLAAQAEHVPLHVGALPFAVKSVSEFFADDIHPGDVFLLNDPYHGGNHLPDLTCFVPVFIDGNDKPVFWTLNRAHQSDIGGATHGSYNPAATEIYQEGLRISPLKLVDRGEMRKDVLHMICTNVRHASDFRGDLRAMVGSAHGGAARIAAMLKEYGVETMQDAVNIILDGTDRQTRACVKEWTDGVYEGESILDDDGHSIENIRLHAVVTKKGETLHVDLTGCDPQVKGIVNSSYANTVSAVHMALAFLIDPRTPKNEGAFRSISLTTKPGTIAHPLEPAPVTLSTNHPSQEICECVIKALTQACPERVFAGWGRRFRIAIKGKNPRTGKDFIWHMFHARPGGGASIEGDGWPGAGEVPSGGGLKFGSTEVGEGRFPLFFKKHEFRPDCAGEGKYRGGMGAILELRMETNEESAANCAGDGRFNPPYGILGGNPGKPHFYRKLSAEGDERVLKTKEVGVSVSPGDLFILQSSGGGGYGDPAERDPAAIAKDIENGFVSG